MSNEIPSTNTNGITITFGGSNIALTGFVLSFCSLVIERDFNMINKHKHYEMIVAKAANMDLIQFVKFGDEWILQGCHENAGIAFEENYQYFLCLPQHKEACLHWLNGGEAQTKFEGEWGARATPKSELGDWFPQVIWMQDVPIRIKPKKEKRWIVYRNGAVYGEYLSPEDINDDFKMTGQVIEIEVEV